jgi:hypothetical protein
MAKGARKFIYGDLYIPKPMLGYRQLLVSQTEFTLQ